MTTMAGVCLYTFVAVIWLIIFWPVGLLLLGLLLFAALDGNLETKI